jgi:DNA-binding MarR family transcriptional regulator/GNAT superfamily N-acetyltransferase
MAGVEAAMTGAPASGDQVETVRGFNRFWTRQIGVLQAGLLQTSFSLTEARVLFELAHRAPCDATALRDVLDLDSGYMSRVVTGLKAQGLVGSRPDATDARRQLLDLTSAGRGALEDLDARSRAQVGEMLVGLSEWDRDRLLGAMGVIRSLLDPEVRAPAYVLRPPRAGDFGWVVRCHGFLYTVEHAWDHTFEALVARVVADYVEHHDPRVEACWIAERSGEPVGSVFCCRRDETTAQLRLLLVEPSARGLGIGARLVEECLTFARRAGYERIVLWTSDVLVSARRIYEAAGFELTGSEAHRSFGHDLIGQDWMLQLR